MIKEKKYYVVWKGQYPGVYDTWEACKQQVEGYTGAVYKGFSSKAEAEAAFENGFKGNVIKKASSGHLEAKSGPIARSISVDAACSGNPGKMEYRGVNTMSKAQIFHMGPFEDGTNNIGEFLAIVHGLAALMQQKDDRPVYSDSQNAMLWVRNKKCRTKLERTSRNKPVFELIARAEQWLMQNSYPNPVLKWETEKWGENPADFGRK